MSKTSSWSIQHYVRWMLHILELTWMIHVMHHDTLDAPICNQQMDHPSAAMQNMDHPGVVVHTVDHPRVMMHNVDDP